MNVFTALFAAIELLAPNAGTPVALVPGNQKAVMSKATLEERQKLFAEDRKNGKKIRHGQWRKAEPFTVKWRCTDGEKGPWKILIGKKPDLSDAKAYLFTGAVVDKYTGRAGAAKSEGVKEMSIPRVNLEIATKYYWRVCSNLTCGQWGHTACCNCKDRRPVGASEIGSFTTEDFAPRWIEIEGRTGNFRDLGGRIGLGGRRVRQGMVYRSQGLNDNSVDGATSGRNRLMVEDVAYLTGELGIRTDLDLRSRGEIAGMNLTSPLGKSVSMVWHSSAAYEGVFKEDGMKTMAENFRVFCDRKNYPILFHCIGGADRTGALGYVLNGVLGVKRQELETDWESTFYPTIPEYDAKGGLVWNSEHHFENGFSKYGDANTSWNDRIVLYLKACGITDDEIGTFREIMLAEDGR